MRRPTLLAFKLVDWCGVMKGLWSTFSERHIYPVPLSLIGPGNQKTSSEEILSKHKRYDVESFISGIASSSRLFSQHKMLDAVRQADRKILFPTADKK